MQFDLFNADSGIDLDMIFSRSRCFPFLPLGRFLVKALFSCTAAKQIENLTPNYLLPGIL
jgi:hypothetical protein